MEDDSLGDSSDIKEQSGREPDYSLGIDGVIRISCLNWSFQVLVGSLCFRTNLQSIQEILAPLSMRAWVLMAFIMCEGMISWTGICIVGEDFTNTFAQETEGRVCIGELFLFKNPRV